MDAQPTMRYLEEARTVTLNDPSSYSKIVPILLPIIGPNAALEQRRWGADFLAEMFASPIFASEEKQQLAVQDRNPSVLDTLLGYLERQGEDSNVVRSALQTAASIYPLVFRQIINNPTDQSWSKMLRIKSNILRRMDSTAPGIRIVCIKFIQRVVQTQTPGFIDPRRPDQSEISSQSVPRDHPILVPGTLEAEATALLDRLMDILQENASDALVITATLNSLGSLIRMRPAIATKIVSKLLEFNPLKLANSPMTPKNRVMIKSIERTTRSLLQYVIKKCPPFTDPNNPFNRRIDEYIQRIHRMRVDILDDTHRKRPLPVEPTESLDNKRLRLGQETVIPQLASVPLPSQGPVSFADLFTLTTDPGLRRFDATAIPQSLLLQILTPLLGAVQDDRFKEAMNAVSTRWLTLSKAQAKAAAEAATAAIAAAPSTATATMDDDDDEYDPSYEPGAATTDIQQPQLPLGPFRLPTPAPLADIDIAELSKGTINRLYGMVESTEEFGRASAQKKGFNRLAASSQDRDAWITVMIRLATRAGVGLDPNPSVKAENVNKKSVLAKDFVPNAIRDTLYNYVLRDWKRRIGVGIQWLTEEWYNDRVTAQQQQQQQPEGGPVGGINQQQGNYDTWTLKLLDGFVEYLDVKDQATLIRFLGEMPELSAKMLEKVKELAKDPERIGLVIKTMHYLVLMRPPVREIALDVVADMYRSYAGSKGPAKPLLSKWRPYVLAEEPPPQSVMEGSNGVHA